MTNHPFTLVTGLGHCGSTWLATVLDAQPEMRAFHELKQKIANRPWIELAEIEYTEGMSAQHVQDYVWAIQTYQERGLVADVNSWWPPLIDKLTEQLDINQVYALIRNPIQQLHSLYTRSYAWSQLPADHFIYTDYLHPLHLDMESTRWERLCGAWSVIGGTAAWLEMRGLKAQTIRLEDLTYADDALAAIAPGLTHEQRDAFRRTDINRKVTGDRRSEALFASWTDEQRRALIDLCEPTMVQWGYPIPERV